ncbi:MAG: T9SS type A sorting domain-containing protein [Crocinitomicaceae bacterium]|nr:T9SS type A sorting domain-containing protein [Crocinitomicaceae bacterium]
MYAINGQELIRAQTQNSSTTLNTEDLVQGTYILVVKSQTKIYHWKLVK